jgi:protein ImuA
VQCLSEHISNLHAEPTQALLQASACMLSEIFPMTAAEGSVSGFVLSSAPKTSTPILWIQDSVSQKEAGRPYLPGLFAKRSLIHLTLPRADHVLWAMEEGLRCTALALVIGEIWGDPPVLDFTATRRLATRSEAIKIPCWLVRRGGTPDLSAARNRWRISSLPSLAHPHDPKAPGDPRWQVELFRSRQALPGIWVATYDRAADRIDFAAPFRHGTVAEDKGTTERRSA